MTCKRCNGTRKITVGFIGNDDVFVDEKGCPDCPACGNNEEINFPSGIAYYCPIARQQVPKDCGKSGLCDDYQIEGR